MKDRINLEEIILEAYGCKDAHEFQRDFDISMQMIKEICVEACKQTIELASNKAETECDEGGETGFVNRQSITDVINLID